MKEHRSNIGVPPNHKTATDTARNQERMPVLAATTRVALISGEAKKRVLFTENQAHFKPTPQTHTRKHMLKKTTNISCTRSTYSNHVLLINVIIIITLFCFVFIFTRRPSQPEFFSSDQILHQINILYYSNEFIFDFKGRLF